MNTPKTEAVLGLYNDTVTKDDLFLAYFARRLERKRDEAREELAGIEDKMRVRLGDHPNSKLWGEAGLIEATMRAARLASTLENVIQKFRNEEDYLLLDKSSRVLGSAIAYDAMADELSKLISQHNAKMEAPNA